MLNISHISKQYANHQALTDICLHVNRGGMHGLLGPNGAGKTTLIRIINGIISSDSGSVSIEGQPLSPQIIRSLGYLPEERGLYRKMRVADQAVYLARLRGMSRADAQRELTWWMRRFDMTGWENKRIDQLSKGMAQKVQFVISILHRPSLVILDEPFSGFDPINVEEIRQAITDLNREGTTFILSTHDMSQVEQLCTTISLIHRSRIVLDGRIDDIRRQHATHRFRLRCPDEIRALPQGVSLSAHHQDRGVHTYELQKAPEMTHNQLIELLLPTCTILSFEEIMPGMHDIFIQTVADLS
ncbi:MAG: ATP-binding cassette domain-containing protein [Paludibacteraceae bacterium]|nr:ATP-binding cassette domain-containing protein [Paludibacteraceae bacterium]